MADQKHVRPATPKTCPVCGEDVPAGALACPECGADHKSGWREDAEAYDGVDLPDEDFNYDDFVKAEFGSQTKPPGLRTIWWIAGMVLLVAFLVIYLYR